MLQLSESMLVFSKEHKQSDLLCPQHPLSDAKEREMTEIVKITSRVLHQSVCARFVQILQYNINQMKANMLL